jgi:hypothetical protein
MSAARDAAPPLHVEIEELRLEGFEPRDRHRIAHAFERELTRLLASRIEHGGFEPPQDSARIDGGSFTVRADEPPHRIGRAIAFAAVRGLTGEARGSGPLRRE